jgi:hypothetical protein
MELVFGSQWKILCGNLITGGNMHRKLMFFAGVALVVVMSVSMAFAMGGGNARKGKFLYRKNCRSCHNGTDAKDLSPADKTQAEWKATFGDIGKIKCSGDWTVNESDLNDIFTYLYDYAKDSPSPAKCS